MTNHTRLKRPTLSWLVAICTCGSLGGCVAAVVPIAASGLIGRSATHKHAHSKSPAATTPTSTSTPTPVAAIASVPAAPATDPIIPSTPENTVPSPKPAPFSETPKTATAWGDVVQYMAKLVLLPPDRSRSSVLRSPDDRSPAPCTSALSAVIVDAVTLGRDDYVDLGAIHTMGYEIAFTSATPNLPAAQIAALTKVGIAAPVRRETLFFSPPGGEKTARTAIAARYCVVGIVGSRAADFPGSILPGTGGTQAGWFLIARP